MKPLFPVLVVVTTVVSAFSADPISTGPWQLPEAREVDLGGPWGEAYHQGTLRLSQPPYNSPLYLRSDFSFETNRVFVNYSGDISGRFIQISSLVSGPGGPMPSTLSAVLRDFSRYQKADGHFGREVDWSSPLEPENSNAVLLPILWGNSRLLVGLIEAFRSFGREDCLAAAKRMGDFYIKTSGRFLDPAREPEYRMTGTYAAGYVTDYFPGIEGLALLYQVTGEERYLRQAERMAEFFSRYDTLPIDHSHGNLVTHYGLLLLYEITGKQPYLERPLAQWRKAMEGGYVWPLGGVGERFQINSVNDEGCSEADWLRLNLRLWKLTGQTRFLDCAERLLWNHYAMNRTANGGYGHHVFVSDSEGPLLMQPQFTEAVWCCTFHGLLGMHILKSHVLVGSPKGVFVNFPVAGQAPVQVGQGRCKVAVTAKQINLGQVECRVRLNPLEGATQVPDLFMRRPSWADRVDVADGKGNPIKPIQEAGYLHLSNDLEAGQVIVFNFLASPRVEDRRLHLVPMKPQGVTRHSGVTLSVGPHLLLGNVSTPRPVLVARVSHDGKLLLPGSHRFLQVGRFDATEEEIGKSQSSLTLNPWPRLDHQAPAAFVFDLILVPEDSALGKTMNQD